MGEDEKRDFHRFVEYVLQRFENDDARLDFESFILVLHNIIKKEQKGVSLSLITEQLLHYDCIGFVIPHFGEKTSTKTLSWVQRNFFEDLYCFLVFVFGADHKGEMNLSEDDLSMNQSLKFYKNGRYFQNEKCSVHLSGDRKSLFQKDFFITSIVVIVK